MPVPGGSEVMAYPLMRLTEIEGNAILARNAERMTGINESFGVDQSFDGVHLSQGQLLYPFRAFQEEPASIHHCSLTCQGLRCLYHSNSTSLYLTYPSITRS